MGLVQPANLRDAGLVCELLMFHFDRVVQDFPGFECGFDSRGTRVTRVALGWSSSSFELRPVNMSPGRGVAS